MVTEIHIHQGRSAVDSGLAGTSLPTPSTTTQPAMVTGPSGIQYPLNGSVGAGPTQPATTLVSGAGSGSVPPTMTVMPGVPPQRPMTFSIQTAAAPATTAVIPAATDASMAGVGVGSGTMPQMAAAPAQVTIVPPTAALAQVAAGGVGMGTGAGADVGAMPPAPTVVPTGNIVGGSMGGTGIPVGGAGMPGAGYGAAGTGAGYGSGMGAGYGSAGVGTGVTGARPPTSSRIAGDLQQVGGCVADSPEMMIRGQARRTGLAPLPSTAQDATMRRDTGMVGAGGARYVPGVGPTYY
ncbi:hypothetical protein BC835DRAFT_1413790 [Cytidiella melzeri]|nr:hypothetical protein BC835DRAFT_1413790 [Cytidiella melzeri]